MFGTTFAHILMRRRPFLLLVLMVLAAAPSLSTTLPSKYDQTVPYYSPEGELLQLKYSALCSEKSESTLSCRKITGRNGEEAWAVAALGRNGRFNCHYIGGGVLVGFVGYSPDVVDVLNSVIGLPGGIICAAGGAEEAEDLAARNVERVITKIRDDNTRRAFGSGVRVRGVTVVVVGGGRAYTVSAGGQVKEVVGGARWGGRWGKGELIEDWRNSKALSALQDVMMGAPQADVAAADEDGEDDAEGSLDNARLWIVMGAAVEEIDKERVQKLLKTLPR